MCYHAFQLTNTNNTSRKAELVLVKNDLLASGDECFASAGSLFYSQNPCEWVLRMCCLFFYDVVL